MLACAALVACTNDDIVENDVKQPQPEELANVPAYVTISLSTANSSSRATVTGDKDGNSENSGHENEGTTDENTFNDIAVIIKTVDENGINVKNSGVATIIDITEENVTTIKAGNETTLTLKSAFKVLAGTHKVLTIVNPTQAIKDAITNVAGDYIEIGNLYDNLTDKDGGLLSSYGLKYEDISTCANAIMFVNRDEVVVTAKSTDSETNPAVASITLERPVAKIAYRGSAKGGQDNTYPIEITVTAQKYNIVYRAEDKAEKNPFALVKDAADRTRAVKVTKNGDDYNIVVNEGTGAPTECYAYENETIGVTALTPIVLQGEPDAIPDNNYYLTKTDEKWDAPKFIFTPYTYKLNNASDNGGWKVQLTHYALINMVNDSHVIRHTTDNLGATVNTFGLLTGQNYIADPYFTVKNAAASDYKFADYATWGEAEWGTWNTAAQRWFANTLKDVADETSGTKFPQTHFVELPTVSAEASDDHSTMGIGEVLQYAFENGVASHSQLHGLTTGIVFKGTVVGSLPTMYQYGTAVYENLDEIIKAYGPGNKAIEKIGQEIAKNADYATTDDGKKAIKDAGIKIYANNECYYYTNQIKHFDNGDPNVAGNMEFAIVRNNIYSLAVKDIKGIGDAAIDPNPGTENESAVGYIKVEAKIIPWIVRFNDIEF